MNSMNDERFFDLAVKAIAHQANDAERADLDALLAREPELRAEFTRLEADARVAKDALPLVNAVFFSVALGMIEGFVANLGAYGFRFFVIESVHVVSFWSFWETPLSAKKRYSSPISNCHPKVGYRQGAYLFHL